MHLWIFNLKLKLVFIIKFYFYTLVLHTLFFVLIGWLCGLCSLLGFSFRANWNASRWNGCVGGTTSSVERDYVSVERASPDLVARFRFCFLV